VTSDLAALIEQLRHLESSALAIYTMLAKAFEREPELHRFWMSMARHEAGHVGAIALISELIEQGGHDVEVGEAAAIAREASAAVDALHAEARRGVQDRERAFAIALELEGLEVEDVVLDLIHVLSDATARRQAEQMLLHDLSDLSLIIEKYSRDEGLLAKADALVEERVERPDRVPTVARRVMST
jgi:hypothetical protein